MRYSIAQKRRYKELGNAVLKFTFVFFIAVAFAMPFFWMISSSLKTVHEVFQYPIKWFPENPQWSNYVERGSKLLSQGTINSLNSLLPSFSDSTSRLSWRPMPLQG